jgi:hypothetical protein
MKNPKGSSVVASLLLFVLPLCAGLASAQTAVIVNDVVLDEQTHEALERTYRTKLVPGRYWYDTTSGLWGLEGGPSLGQIVAGLQMGRALAADASVRSRWQRTHVFINGREIHRQELTYLTGLFGTVLPGRYWLNARGIAGYEGGPPQFDLRAAAMARGNRGSGSGHGHRGVFGNTGSDGSCSYYNDPSSGASVMTGDC